MQYWEILDHGLISITDNDQYTKIYNGDEIISIVNTITVVREVVVVLQRCVE